MEGMTPLQKRLSNLGACRDFIDWVGERTLLGAWEECPRGDWLLWYLECTGVDRRQLIQVATKCIEPVAHIIGDARSYPRIVDALRYASWAMSYDIADDNLNRQSYVERRTKRRMEYLQWCADIVRSIFPYPED